MQAEKLESAKQSDQTEQNNRAGQTINQPALRDRQHPRPDERDELPGKEKLKVLVPQSA